MADVECKHKPPCPVGTPRWHCQKRTEIETAVHRCDMERAAGKSILDKFGLPMRDETATERYNREQKRIDKGLLF